MAERRMFTKKITEDDNFMALSASAQALYFHLSMAADDDGFCNQVSISMFRAHASVQDLEALLNKRFVYQFENGVIVIKHWRMANALRRDRYTPTAFQEELAMLDIKENGSYTWAEREKIADSVAVETPLATERQPNGNHLATQDSIGKDSIGKDIKHVVEYLNGKAGTKFKSTTEATKKHINARLSEGYTLEDFETVIDKRCDEWMGTELQQYLRPNTLFGTKFESYLNAPKKQKKESFDEQLKRVLGDCT